MQRTPKLRKRRGEKLANWEDDRKRIRDGPNHRAVQETLNAIRSSFGEDTELSVASQQVSLLCPISNKRMTEAARGENCTHFQCFDLGGFLQLQSKTPHWDCPVSNCKKELTLDTLVIDEYFNGALQETDESVTKVELLPNGTWQPVSAEVPPTTVSSVLRVVEDVGDVDMQVVAENIRVATQDNRSAVVPVSVLDEIHSKNKEIFHQFNALGYKRLGPLANALAEMNAYIKQKILEANEPQPTDQPAVADNAVSMIPRLKLDNDALVNAFSFLDRLHLEKLQYCCHRYRMLIDDKMSDCCFRVIGHLEIDENGDDGYKVIAELRPGRDPSMSNTFDYDDFGSRQMIYAASARTSRAAVIPSICRNAIVDTFVVSCRVDSSWLCGFDQPLLLRCQRLSPKKYPLRGNSDLYQLFECFSCVDELDLHDGAEFHGDADFGLQLDADFLRRCARHAHKHLNFGDYYYYRRQFAKFTEDAVVEFLSGAAGNSKERILQIGEIDWLSPASILKMVNIFRNAPGAHHAHLKTYHTFEDLRDIRKILGESADVTSNEYGRRYFTFMAEPLPVEVVVSVYG